jgi:hypothetical protein
MTRPVLLAVALAIGCLARRWAQTPDPLLSWNEDDPKKTIVDFLARRVGRR